VRKTENIQKELGSLAPVVEKNVSRLLGNGIRHQDLQNITESINQADKINLPRASQVETINAELEAARVRQQDLTQQISQLQEMLKTSRDWLNLDDRHFRSAISASLEILDASPLTPLDQKEASEDPITARWIVPALDQRTGADPTWSNTLDTLRVPRQRGEKPWE